MTRALKKAFDAASKLPEAEQDALAAAILEELESERRWDEVFQGSPDTLVKLAQEGSRRGSCGPHKAAGRSALISRTTERFRKTLYSPA
jgi:hypothetical protein